MPRGAHEHNDRWKPSLWTHGKEHPVWAPPRTVPGKSQPQNPGKDHQDQSWEEGFRSRFMTEGSGYCLGVGDPLWNAGEEYLGITLDLCDVKGKNQWQGKQVTSVV